MVIREFDSISDFDGLRQCVISLQDFEREIDPRMPPGASIVDDYIADIFRRCSEQDGKILVADSNGSVAGYVLVFCKVVCDDIIDGSYEFGRISDLVVLDDFRGMGLGKNCYLQRKNLPKIER